MPTVQAAVIQAAASIAALMPKKPKSLRSRREDFAVYSVFEQAAKAAYLRAAQECLMRGYDALGSGAHTSINLDEVSEFLSDKSVSLKNLILRCEPGFQWGGRVVTL